jgi:hypothetical protein
MKEIDVKAALVICGFSIYSFDNANKKGNITVLG